MDFDLKPKIKTGRPLAFTKDVKIRLRESEHEALKEAGGSDWIRNQLRLRCLITSRTIDTSLFTEEERQLFMEGWRCAGGFIENNEGTMPWNRPRDTTIQVRSDCVKDMGAEYWRTCQAEFSEFLKTKNSPK